MLEEDGYQMINAFLKYCKFSNKISLQIMEESQITGQVKNIKRGWSKFIMTYISYFTFFSFTVKETQKFCKEWEVFKCEKSVEEVLSFIDASLHQ